MAKGLNKVILLGNVGNINELKYSTNGNPYISFSLATSESWKDKGTGEKKEVTEWHNCICFGALSEIIGKYVAKGSKLYVEGSIHSRTYKGQDGTEKHKTEITVKDVLLLDKKNAPKEEEVKLNPPGPSLTLDVKPVEKTFRSTGVFVPIKKEEAVLNQEVDDVIPF